MFPQEISSKLVSVLGITQDHHIALVVILVLFGYFSIIVLFSGSVLYACQSFEDGKGSSSGVPRKTGAILKGSK